MIENIIYYSIKNRFLVLLVAALLADRLALHYNLLNETLIKVSIELL